MILRVRLAFRNHLQQNLVLSVRSKLECAQTFLQKINLKLNAPMAVTIRFRKWVVRQQNGETIVVEGDGVVGQFPRLEPGGEFSYNSCHTISQNSRAEGAYFAETDDGRWFCVRIPAFNLELPQWV